MIIRAETPADYAEIAALVAAAFAPEPHSDGSEPAIIERLRAANALQVALVAEEGGQVLGHIAASPATVDGQGGWSGIGPLAARPGHQRQGIGSALMRAALTELRTQGLRGAVLVGDPAYYSRFGFARFKGLFVPDIPDWAVQALPFGAEQPKGRIRFHKAFGLPE
ncbi:GNAT family N-acetyltransferase [Pseudothioclava arenosa]|uniref:GNAT family N-acetyltransferase n=1 Tax=Pseudothioclava arenosa TaxID=1795308 RepID=A0A2A4CM36_9RHOB|nr:N-acetyltransferase [Pseudothioclava arenosa]PCD75665.1 GNAT family N-acetyltransferase [Pseudothioclava arenosa]